MADKKEEDAKPDVKPPPMELSENEKRLLEAAQKNELEEVKLLLKEKDVRVDCLDQYGSTPLQLAAFRGNIEVCQTLLAHGADVNNNEHEHGYTALMFAALSGKADLCRILMEAGAKTYKTNKVGRTATEMAAFTGQHHCVSIINNFLAVEDIERYTKPQGSEKEARLPSHFTEPLHKLTLTYNIHPVKLILFLCDNIDLVQHEKQLLFCLEDLMERQMKRKDANEVMAFKLHMILSVMKACFKQLKDSKADTSKTDKEKLTLFAKGLLATKDENFARHMELFMRQIIKEYPYHHSVLFQTMVRTLSQTEIGQDPTAVSVANQALIGQRMASDETFCMTCGTSPSKKRCGSCKMVSYCSPECQKLHWFAHKRWCPDLAKQMEEFMITRKKLAEQERQQEEANKEASEESANASEAPNTEANDGAKATESIPTAS